MTRCHICGDTGYWTGLTRPHGDPDPPAEYTGPRCTDREATAILSSHQDHPEHRPSLATMADGTCGCTLCRALRDLLDTRRERDEAMPVLEAARAQTERHTATGVKAHLALLIVSGHSCQCGLCMAIRAHDAARAAKGGERE